MVRFVTILASLRALALLKRASVSSFSNIACDTCRKVHDEWSCDTSHARQSHLVLSKENTHA